MTRLAVIYDNIQRPDTTGEHCLQALRSMCDVEHFLPTQLNTVPRKGFDLYLHIDDGLRYRFPSHLRPSAWWVIDTHLSYDWDLQKAADFDLVFAAQRDGAERLKADGVARVQWLPLACNPELHRRHETPKDLDVCFVGNGGSEERVRLLRLLGETFPLHFIGNAYGDEMALLYSRAKLAFNRSISNDVNMRVFEALACGGLLITNDLSDNGQADLFEDGRHLVTYSADDELLDKIRYYLAHDDEREAIAEAGRQEVLAKHTYGHRMASVLEALEQFVSEGGLAELASKERSFPGYYHFSRPDLLALIPEDAKRVLDIGCAAGRMGEQLKLRQGAEVVGVELSPDVAAEARERLDEVAVGDIESIDLPFPEEHFDCIVFGDVLEHLRDPAAALRKALRHLRPEGSVVASVPNVRNAKVITDLVGGRWSYEAAGILDADHLRFFTLHDIHELLRSCGLTVTSVSRVFDPQHGGWVAAGRPPNLQFGLAGIQARSPQDAEEFFVVQYLVRARPVTGVRESRMVSIVIPACNQLDYTKLCLDSLARFTVHPHEVIFVDNGSDDGTPEYLAGRGNVHVLRNEENLGFVKACNQGIEAASGDYVLLLNNDTIVTAGWLTRLVDVAETDKTIGMVGPITNCSSGPQQVSVGYETPDELHHAAQGFAEAHAGATIDTERLVGFCLLIKREVVDAIGGLDERFGLGLFDDDDLSMRARLAGYRLVYTPGVFVHHFGGRTFAGLGLDAASMLDENWREFDSKWQADPRGADRVRSLYTTVPGQAAAVAPGKPEGGNGRDSKRGKHSRRAGKATRLARRERPANAVEPRAGTVSLCMIVKNEEANLPRCLESVQGIFDEVIIVDTGSEDRTREIAVSFGASVHEFPWIDDFSAARNESLKHATSEWVMWMDADDSLDEENRARLREVISGLNDGHTGYVMVVRCLSAEDGSVTEVDHVKLFRNLPELRFEYRVHEQILPTIRRMNGKVGWTDVVICHHGYQDTRARRGKLERDRRILTAELDQRPDDPFCLFNLGCIEQELGSPETAIANLWRSIRLSHPHDSQVRKAYAMVLQMERERGDVAASLAAWDEARANYPEDPELLFQAALSYRACGDYQRAEEGLLKALDAPEEKYFSSMDPGIRGHKARHNLAVMYLETGRPAEAWQQWQAAIAETPGFGPAWDGLAELALRRGDWQGLDELAARARAETRSEPLALMVEARSALGRQQFDEALARLRAVLDLDPRSEAAQRTLTYALLQAGRTAEAEPELRRLLEMAPSDAEAHHNLAALLSSMGRHAEALDPARRATELQPTRPSAYYILAEAYERTGAQEMAIATLQHLLRVAPAEDRARTMLASLTNATRGVPDGRLWRPPGLPNP